ncbi:multidrug ABC transporter ATP-binding protein [Bacillus safensis FO-36b]|uniref:ABC transporter ATP-binding protein n=1 Tax=Bacillus safensis TaxID=561879 RepID=UPI00045CBEC9|nr:ABC transporter ATP-binding protein [Bacillus safensis]ARD56911.1 multidrug ABC transporter permease [Bacillus safensis]AWI37489.1 multidrug ABC transporter permease [Bacillus safensis FO-36b]KDE29193.1 multidrug ABC transporter ATP-binding protein [Bacillus safensis FO-36b]MCM3049393.1 ABC transporter ATP-binding protein/permease [Bacillus safensis]MEC1047174.1 ABC transporter ATP-binding protein [Bacillus safensis]
MQGKISQLWILMKRSQMANSQLVLLFFISIVEVAAGLAVPLLTMKLINQISDTGFALTSLLPVIGVLIVQAMLSAVTFYMMRRLGEGIVANLRTEVWAHMLHLRLTYYDAHESGETMSRITQDTNVVKEFVTEKLVSFVSGLFAILGAIVVLLWIDWKMTLLLLIAVPLTIFVTYPLGEKMYAISKANQDELAGFGGRLGRILTNIRLVKASQTEQQELAGGEKQIKQLYKYGLKEAKIVAILSPLMTLLMMVVIIAIFGYGGSQVASGAISSGELVAIMIYLVQIIMPFTQMATFFTDLQKTLGATERIVEALDEKREVQDGKPVTAASQPIQFENVSFKYNEKYVLKGMTFTLKPNETTAFVSRSGGGKTTMFSLIERFYDVSSGAILYGKENIEQFNLTEWRGLFGYVSQNAPLLNGTIRDNVMYGTNGASEQEVLAALKAAYAYDFVMQLDKRLDTEVGEGGIKLSGGQKQRIAIARAILRNPRILLLDEATSNLDNESEREVQLALQALTKNRMTIIIAHRLSTITSADQILVFEDGRLSGQGTHEELQKTHPYYQQLWQNGRLTED